MSEQRLAAKSTVVGVIFAAGQRVRDALTDNRAIKELDARVSVLMVRERGVCILYPWNGPSPRHAGGISSEED